MRELESGLPTDVAREWGFPYLKKSRTEYTYHDECCDCEGHPVEIPLPESEWYWAPRHRIVDMSCFPVLKSEGGALFKAMSMLGKGAA